MRNQELLEAIEELPKELSEDWIEQAMEKLDKSRMTQEQRMHYEMMMAKNASILEMKKNEREEIISEAKRKADKSVRVETAIKMLKRGMKIDDISELTNLTKEEISDLEI